MLSRFVSMVRAAGDHWLPWCAVTAAAVAAPFLLTGCGSDRTSTPHPPAGDESQQNRVGPPTSAASLSQSFRTAATRVLPAVVQILQHDGFADPEASSLGGNLALGYSDSVSPPAGALLGSGVLVDSAGIVLTNHHVVESAQTLRVRTADGQSLQVKRVASDAHSDLAMLELESNGGLPAAPFGDSRALQIGDWVLTIGSPLDLGPTVSAGIISATGRIPEGAGRVPLLQTDAAINPGSSGGALVNLAGELVGIATAIASRDGGFQGIGFAIPSDTVQWVSHELRTNGVVRRADIGVETVPVPPGSQAGARVVETAAGSAAQQAGLRPGDLIVAVNGQTVDHDITWRALIERQEIGAACQLDIVRDGGAVRLEVVTTQLVDRPIQDEAEPLGPSEMDTTPAVYSVELEMSVTELTADDARRIGRPGGNGVRVARVDPGGPAEQAGVQRAMIVLAVGDQNIADLDDFADCMEHEELAQGIVLKVLDTHGPREIHVRHPQ